ncbi:MAG: HD domain-containing protein [Oscillospiraceae bacterium]|nr:HD domain-containing protein [Oscillospiraceae bacterium]
MVDDIIEAAKLYIRDLFDGDHSGHDTGHTLRVYRNAMYIADHEPCDKMTVALASLLHDADDHKLFDTAENANARAFLAGRVSEEETERICAVINSVSFSANRGRAPESAEAAVVRDADRLDAIGAVGIARTFAYGGAHGRSLDESVQHFYDKLLLLCDEMITDTARKIAADRHAFLQNFLDEYRKETDGTGMQSKT